MSQTDSPGSTSPPFTPATSVAVPFASMADEWTKGLSEKAVELYTKIEGIVPGELKGYGELAGKGALAASGQRDSFYKKEGLEFEIPLHRLMSTNDKYACVDGEFGLGLIQYGLNDEQRRVYKCAIREIEGAYTPGDEPSKKGLPPQKAKKPKKRKAGAEEAEEAPAPPVVLAPVSADVVRAVVERMAKYRFDNGVAPAELYRHGPELLKVVFA